MNFYTQGKGWLLIKSLHLDADSQMSSEPSKASLVGRPSPDPKPKKSPPSQEQNPWGFGLVLCIQMLISVPSYCSAMGIVNNADYLLQSRDEKECSPLSLIG